MRIISISSGTMYIYFAMFSGIIMLLKKNLAICWELFYIKINNKYKGQLAGNLEILRDFTQEFSLSHNKTNQLGYYLAGLIEADGSIIVPKEKSKNTPTISISFNNIDRPLALCIKDRIGFGYLENIESRNALRLIIRGRFNIIKLVTLINGKFRTPKIEKLHDLINYINNIWLIFKEKLILLPLNTESLANNNWLAGFSDGDACFNINITWPDNCKNVYGQIRLTFEIVQSRMDLVHLEKYKEFMNTLSGFLQSKLEIHYISKYDRSGKQKAWRARISNKKGTLVIVNYFDKYSLFSSKYLNYNDWRSVHNMLDIKKEHIGENKLDVYKKVKDIKNRMNKKRLVYNWDHLNNFYI